MPDPRSERLARNEAIFRVANERLAGWEERHADGAPESYYCECADPTCQEQVSLHEREYEAVRADSRHFFVATGHDDPSIERVVQRTDRFDVIEKHEEVHGLVERTDPRRS